MSKTILLIGTLDTKGHEYEYIRDLILARGHRTLVLDAGVLGEPTFTPDIAAVRTAAAGGGSLAELRETPRSGSRPRDHGPRRARPRAAAAGDGRFDAVYAMGGSGGTSIGATAMQALPVGLPKLIVSTMASGNVAPYVDVKDITMMYSVVDVSGLNRVSRRVFANAAGAICGMAEQASRPGPPRSRSSRPRCSASPRRASIGFAGGSRTRGYEVLVFHAIGSGGRSMESLIADGFVTGVADVTTTEWCDELVGGVLSAGPDRLDAAATHGRAAGRLARRARHGQLRAARHAAGRSSRTATSTSTTRR